MEYVAIASIYIFFITVGRIQHLIWEDKTNSIAFLDYHALMAIMFGAYYIGLIVGDLTAVQVLSHSAIGNVLFEMMNKNTWKIRTDDKTFNIFGYLIPYRWWAFYVVPPAIGVLALIVRNI